MLVKVGTLVIGFAVVAVAFAWLSYIGLRMLGRKHLVKPNLGNAIRAVQEEGRYGADYHI